MAHKIEHHADALGCARVELQAPVFDLQQEDQSLFDAPIAQTSALRGVLESTRKRIPLPRSAVASMQGHFYRLPNHNRSFCYSLATSAPVLDAAALVFKGCEPLMADFQTMLDWMSQAPLRKSGRVMVDHFPLAEGKIPGALSLNEACREAQIALAIQRRHLRHYGELARMPVPLLIHAIPAAHVAAFHCRCEGFTARRNRIPLYSYFERRFGAAREVGASEMRSERDSQPG